jgi:hypothetical protein
MNRLYLLLVTFIVSGTIADAQTVSTGISRDTVRVGDPVRIIIRVDGIPPNTEVLLPDSLAAVDDVENGGRVRLVRDTLQDGNSRLTAAYPVLVWRPGETALPQLPMIVRSEGRERTLQVKLPVVNVVSVLPPDTANIEAKPPKDVWGPDRLWWPWLIAAALVLALLALSYWWYRRRRKAEISVPVIPLVDPRERALQELRRIRELRLIEHQDFKQHYILLSEVLRTFAAATEPEWSTDLTTDELAPRVKRRSDATPLIKLLRNSDTVKFARRVPTANEARNDLDAAEAWVRSFNRPNETAEAA